MPLVLILEDTLTDCRKAVDAARRAGFTEFEVSCFAGDARVYLEKAISGDAPAPDAMVVDLSLGMDSGFELLRFWHGNPKLKTIPVIVWTIMDDPEREICRLFGVERFVSKQDGSAALIEALGTLVPDASRKKADPLT
jgi:CheY-like chemotaxis protein